MTEWLPYPPTDGLTHTTQGTIRWLPEVYSPQLDNRRPVTVYLPPSYAQEPARRYPVIYMHDGQNLFDDAISHHGEWQVDETMEMLAADGLEAIIVAVNNMGEERIHELCPFPVERVAAYPEERSRGLGDAYLAFIVETVKPLVDAAFRTRGDRAGTGLAGSSLGGLISLYGYFRYPAVFGLAGVFSPAFWFNADRIYDYVAGAQAPLGRIYMDIGSSEGASTDPDGSIMQCTEDALAVSTLYVSGANRMRDVLQDKGYAPGEGLHYVVEQDGVHHESAWARRLPDAMRFLLGG